jgi:hypothetical protein
MFSFPMVPKINDPILRKGGIGLTPKKPKGIRNDELSLLNYLKQASLFKMLFFGLLVLYLFTNHL